LSSSNSIKHTPYLGSPDSLNQQIAQRLKQAQAQELVNIIGKDTLVDVLQVLFPDVSTEFSDELDHLGISMDEKLMALIQSNKPSIVRHAIDALKEALTKGRVNCPSKFLHHAIQGKWKPNSLKRMQVV
jgi:hypothetical protein